MVAELCRKHGDKAVAEGLFHDAAEAYVGDWIGPLTTVMGPRLTGLRARIEYLCLTAAGLKDRTGAWLSPTARKADELMLRYELNAPWGLKGVARHLPTEPDGGSRTQTPQLSSAGSRTANRGTPDREHERSKRNPETIATAPPRTQPGDAQAGPPIPRKSCAGESRRHRRGATDPGGRSPAGPRRGRSSTRQPPSTADR